MISRLKNILKDNADLRTRLEQVIAGHATENPDRQTNPVQSLSDLYTYAERFLHCLPYQGLDSGENIGLFRRIDQSIGYFYFIFGELQTHPLIARWLADYDSEWGHFLSSPDSWTPEALRLAQADPLFGLQDGRYESPDHWHSWNDFFTRRLSAPPVPFNAVISDSDHNPTILSPCDGCITDRPVKSATLTNWLDMLGDCPYRPCFENGSTFHIVLDMYDYHRFHAPVSGTVLDLRLIDGVHHAGGTIIWDGQEHRYRYRQLGDTSFQMIEKRGVLILDTAHLGKIAIIPVGVAQVSSVNWNPAIAIDSTVQQGEELGCFRCGGSDIVLLFEQDRAPDITGNQTCRACRPLI